MTGYVTKGYEVEKVIRGRSETLIYAVSVFEGFTEAQRDSIFNVAGYED